MCVYIGLFHSPADPVCRISQAQHLLPNTGREKNPEELVFSQSLMEFAGQRRVSDLYPGSIYRHNMAIVLNVTLLLLNNPLDLLVAQPLLQFMHCKA